MKEVQHIQIAIVPIKDGLSEVLVIGTDRGAITVYDLDLKSRLKGLAKQIDKWPYSPLSEPHEIESLIEEIQKRDK